MWQGARELERVAPLLTFISEEWSKEQVAHGFSSALLSPSTLHSYFQ